MAKNRKNRAKFDTASKAEEDELSHGALPSPDLRSLSNEGMESKESVEDKLSQLAAQIDTLVKQNSAILENQAKLIEASEEQMLVCDKILDHTATVAERRPADLLRVESSINFQSDILKEHLFCVAQQVHSVAKDVYSHITRPSSFSIIPIPNEFANTSFAPPLYNPSNNVRAPTGQQGNTTTATPVSTPSATRPQVRPRPSPGLYSFYDPTPVVNLERNQSG